jgi:hypothetical protein
MSLERTVAVVGFNSGKNEMLIGSLIYKVRYFQRVIEGAGLKLRSVSVE